MTTVGKDTNGCGTSWSTFASAPGIKWLNQTAVRVSLCEIDMDRSYMGSPYNHGCDSEMFDNPRR